MVLVGLPVNIRLLIVKFWGQQKLFRIFSLCGGRAGGWVINVLAPPIVQGSVIKQFHHLPKFLYTPL